MIIIISIILLILLLGYILLLYKLHDFKLPSLQLCEMLNEEDGRCKVLIIYPHPDDETMNNGGLIAKLVQDEKFDVTIVSTSYGEKGNQVLDLPPQELMKVREEEFSKVMRYFGVKSYEIWNFGDGEHRYRETEIKNKVREYLTENEFDLVITYERSGIYGHKDHITLSKVIYELHKELGSFKVLYSTLSKQMFEKIELPTYMASEGLENMRGLAEYKLNIVKDLNKKYNAAKIYESQDLTQGKPLWLYKALGIYEYYTSKYTNN